MSIWCHLASSANISSYSFFSASSSGNTSFSHTSLQLIVTKLVKVTGTWPLLRHKRWWDEVRGNYGVTGVIKVIFTKKASSPSDYIAVTRELCMRRNLTPSIKFMVLKFVRGHFGSLGSKVIFTIKDSSPSDYVALTRDLCINSSLTPLQKLRS